MGFTLVGLKDKILELHPEILAQGYNLQVTFDGDAGKYALKFSKGGEELGGYLEKQDADDCLGGKKCVNLAVLVTQLLAELENLLSPRKPG
jgi:hypothetical protein